MALSRSMKQYMMDNYPTGGRSHNPDGNPDGVSRPAVQPDIPGGKYGGGFAQLIRQRQQGPIDPGGVPWRGRQPGGRVGIPAGEEPGGALRPGGGGMLAGMRQQAEQRRAERYPTTSPGVGQTAYRPGYKPPTDYISAAESQARARGPGGRRGGRGGGRRGGFGFLNDQRQQPGFPGKVEPGPEYGRRYAEARAQRGGAEARARGLPEVAPGAGFGQRYAESRAARDRLRAERPARDTRARQLAGTQGPGGGSRQALGGRRRRRGGGGRRGRRQDLR